jgi:nitrite reductase (NADH) small subunit
MSEEGNRRVRVAAESELSDDTGLAVKAGDTTIALFRVEGRCYAIANECPHRGGPLAEGDLEGHIVHCPWHGWTWDVRTGLNPRQPAGKVACFPVTVENGSVFVDMGSDTTIG